jgi:hypothetical protein
MRSSGWYMRTTMKSFRGRRKPVVLVSHLVQQDRRKVHDTATVAHATKESRMANGSAALGSAVHVAANVRTVKTASSAISKREASS